jgi:ketosteroid isomerase-like protein
MPGSDEEPAAPALVAELVRRFRAGDLDGAFALYHPEVRVEQPASLPHGGEHRGHDGARAMAVLFAEHWDREIADPRLLGSADTAVQVTTQRWTAKATGRSATTDVVELFACSGGLITGIRVFPQDTATLLGTLDP